MAEEVQEQFLRQCAEHSGLPNEQDIFSRPSGMSQRLPKGDSAPLQIALLFDDLVRAGEQRRR